MYSQFYFEKMMGKGAFSRDKTVYIRDKYKPVGNPVKDGLFLHHVKQFHESSCSVASVVSAVNTLLDDCNQLNGKPVTQHDLLNKVQAVHWKERMSKNGYKGRRGLPLDTLGEVVKASLDTFEIPYKSVEVIQTSLDEKKSETLKKQLRSRLERFEKKGDCLIIAHFDQGTYLPELHIPHISPVGGYDAGTGEIVMLDVDPEQIYPYRISFDTFYSGISTNYNHLLSVFGYREGGYIFIESDYPEYGDKSCGLPESDQG